MNDLFPQYFFNHILQLRQTLHNLSIFIYLLSLLLSLLCPILALPRCFSIAKKVIRENEIVSSKNVRTPEVTNLCLRRHLKTPILKFKYCHLHSWTVSVLLSELSQPDLLALLRYLQLIRLYGESLWFIDRLSRQR